METTPEVPQVEAALAASHKLHGSLVQFIQGIEQATGAKPWAILAAPEFLQQIVTMLAFRYGCSRIVRPNTHVSSEDVDAFLATEKASPGFMTIRPPAMMAVLFGVPFIGTVGIPSGALCYVPKGGLPPVEVPDGITTTSVG